MPKIQNWSRDRSNENSQRIRAWENDNTGSGLSIRKESTFGGRSEFNQNGGIGYEIELQKKVKNSGPPSSRYKERQVGVAETRDEAIEKAVEWMRNHPMENNSSSSKSRSRRF